LLARLHWRGAMHAADGLHGLHFLADRGRGCRTSTGSDGDVGDAIGRNGG
jgi:hypothetical protein